jgi:C-terminal processing protease CtpA/Prc
MVEKSIAALADAPAILIDLRGNRGGSVSSVVYLAEHFLGPDKSVGFHRYRTGASRTDPFIHRGYFADEVNHMSACDVALNKKEGYVEWRTPKDAPASRANVWILADGECGSSCDAFTAAMKDHHAATVLGARTAGALLSAVAFRPAWRGYVLLAPVGTVLSPDRKVIEGVGVPPDVEIAACASPAGEAGDGANDACRAAALLLIEQALAKARH